MEDWNLIYLTSDLHLGHNKEFIYRPRGFIAVRDMNLAILAMQQTMVRPEDDYYILGDVTLGPLEDCEEYLRQLQGKIHVIRGNHDTDKRIEFYKSLGWDVHDALYLKYNNLHFYLSHYPTITSNLDRESIYQCLINLYGHTHQKTNFFYDMPFCYHVGVDSHNCKPVPIDTIITDIKAKADECLSLL